jgi:hypothetical protein
LAVVYPPGAQVDPAVTDGPWHSRDWLDFAGEVDRFTVPTETLSGARGGGWWPPKPAIRVTFMPRVVEDEYYSRLYPYNYDGTSASQLIADSIALGWHVDQGDLDGEHTHSDTGEVATYGWRCPPRTAWYGSYWREHQVWEDNTWGRLINLPPFHYGAVRDVGTHFSETAGAGFERCPDGRLNAWEVTVPNGVYMVTVSVGGDGCTFENNRVVPKYGSNLRGTHVLSVEVADGRFTLSAGPPRKCSHVNWIKLDLISSTLYPEPWLPAPVKEWWELALTEPEAPVGLVEIRMPHQRFLTAGSYPHSQENAAPDCRKMWLYAPAKCYRTFLQGTKEGIHPDLATYPNFPGFTRPFLEWLFDQHDTDGNGILVYEEFRSAQSQQAIDGTYAMWSRPAKHNEKGTRGYHDDNMRHLWWKLDVFHADYAVEGATTNSKGDGEITKTEFTEGMLAMSRGNFCDLFESTFHTHGGNYYHGYCSKSTNGEVPEHWGYYNDDGAHGFVVSVSNTACSDEDGCPKVSDAGVSLCEIRLHHTSDAPATVDCHGAKGAYVQISLPGDGQRLLPQVDVTDPRSGTAITVFRASFPGFPDVANATDPLVPTVCYGVKPRPVPAADDPNLLAGAKLHPKVIVADNPEDPIFWSTCYDRIIHKEWLPLGSGSNAPNGDTGTAAGEGEGREQKKGVRHVFNNGTYCLSCSSVRQNYARANGYDLEAMLTPRWWLQPSGSCANCDCEVFNTTCPTSSPTPDPTATPSATPSESPTPPPTASPTAEPSKSPTARPTHAPTAAPTMAPTAATCVDATRNGDETDVDCGGSACQGCGIAQACVVHGDCRGGQCEGLICTTVSPTASPSPSPTASPSGEPTEVPTKSPSPSPTEMPTSAPTTTPPYVEAFVPLELTFDDSGPANFDAGMWTSTVSKVMGSDAKDVEVLLTEGGMCKM